MVLFRPFLNETFPQFVLQKICHYLVLTGQQCQSSQLTDRVSIHSLVEM